MQKQEGLVMTQSHTYNDEQRVNQRIRDSLKTNERIISFNTMIYTDLVHSNRVIVGAVEDFLCLLECIDFSRLVALSRFYTIRLDKDEYVDRETYFSFWKNHTFIEDKTAGLCVKPNGSIDRELLQEEVLKDLKDVMLEAECRLDPKSSMLFYRDYDVDGNKVIKVMQNFNAVSFGLFLHAILSPTLRLRDVEQIARNVISFLVGSSISNSIIQFLDCYVEDGDVKEGFSPEAPRFIILREVLNAVKTGKVTKRVKEVDQLLMHLCDENEESFDRVKAILSTIFLNSEEYKMRFSPSIRFYGPSGANGKTLFGDLISRSLNSSNVSDLSLASLDDQHQLESVLSSLVAIDDDSSNARLSLKVTENFKKIVTGKDMQSREIFKGARKVDARCLIILFSNSLPTSSDKTDGFFRRVNVVKCSTRLDRRESLKISQRFYDKIRSEEAAQYLVESLLIESQRLKKEHDLPPMSQEMLNLVERYQEDQDSASAYVETVGIESIVGHHVVDVRQDYEAWCEENDLATLKKQFNDVLKSRYDLIPKSVKHRYISKDSPRYAKSMQSNQAERCWQFSDETKNKEFFEKQDEEV